MQIVPAERVFSPLADYLNSPKAAGAEGKVHTFPLHSLSPLSVTFSDFILQPTAAYASLRSRDK